MILVAHRGLLFRSRRARVRRGYALRLPGAGPFVSQPVEVPRKPVKDDDGYCTEQREAGTESCREPQHAAHRKRLVIEPDQREGTNQEVDAVSLHSVGLDMWRDDVLPCGCGVGHLWAPAWAFGEKCPGLEVYLPTRSVGPVFGFR